MKIRFWKGKDGDQMTVLDGQQEPQEMEDRDRIDIAKNRCAIVFESMQLTAEEIAQVTEEIFESVSVLVDDNEDEEEDDEAPDSLTVMEHVVMALAVIALAMVIVTLA